MKPDLVKTGGRRATATRIGLVSVVLASSAGWPATPTTTAKSHAIRTATHETFSESIRNSRYVVVRDGTQLALDIYRPAAGGKVVNRKLPVILVATPYHRSSENSGEILTFLAPQGNHRNTGAGAVRIRRPSPTRCSHRSCRRDGRGHRVRSAEVLPIRILPVGGEIWTHGLTIATVIGLLVGVLPALRGTRLRIVDALSGH
jgi:X-Pro dipeptidyl-peptidase (S15 family)